MGMIDKPTTPSARPRAARLGLAAPSPDLLWAFLALTLIGAFIALVPTPPNDFWWHLKAGQITANQGIPTTNLFAWSLPADHPYIYATWLGEWLFYALYKIGGLQAPVLARNLLGLAGFTLVAAFFFHWDFGNRGQVIHLYKNIAIAGGFLALFASAAGAYSVDGRRT